MTREALSPENTAHIDTEQTHGCGRVMAVGALTLGCSIIAGAYGALTPTDIELGPHNATAQLTLDPHITFDLGPLGTADKPSGWELGGVRVTVKGIPASANQTPLSGAGAVITQYEELLADPGHIKKAATDTVITRVWHDGIEGAALGATSLAMIVTLTEPGRRRKQQAQAEIVAAIDASDTSDARKAALRDTVITPSHRWGRLCSSALLASALVATACGDSAAVHHPENQLVDQVLANTPFAGFTLHGQLLQLAVDEGGGHLESYIAADTKFYNQVAANFQAAFAEKFQDSPLSHDNLIYIQSISDNHCDIDMDRVHGAIANAFKVDGVIDSGDMTMSGTKLEAECVSAEADALRAKNRGLYFAGGNHDSHDIEQLAQQDGFTVLSLDKPAHLENLSLIGKLDVNESVIGSSIHPRGKETPDQETDEITAAAAKFRPDIIVMHELQMAEPAVKAGYTTFAFTGHTHRFAAPKELNADTQSYLFTEGTSGGAKENALTLGPLQAIADEAVFVFDKNTKRPVGYYRIQAYPDSTVTISDFQSMTPSAPPHRVLSSD